MPSQQGIYWGKVELPEVSGAVFLPGGPSGRLLLVSDEEGIHLADNAGAQLKGGALLPRKLKLAEGTPKFDDLEDLTWDGEKYLYLIGSHSLNRRGDLKKARCKLLRLELDPTAEDQKPEVVDALQDVLAADPPVDTYLSNAQKRTPAQTGLNIEGLQITPDGNLLVGLRSPTVTEPVERKATRMQEDALVVEILNPKAIFTNSGTPAKLREIDPDGAQKGRPTHARALDLGALGIRGFTFDEEREIYWIIAALSVDPNHDLPTPPWSLWGWDGQTAPAHNPKLESALAVIPEPERIAFPEALAYLKLDGESYLLIIEDTAESKYALVPTRLLS